MFEKDKKELETDKNVQKNVSDFDDSDIFSDFS
jgi:hypothetical protein